MVRLEKGFDFHTCLLSLFFFLRPVLDEKDKKETTFFRQKRKPKIKYKSNLLSRDLFAPGDDICLECLKARGGGGKLEPR